MKIKVTEFAERHFDKEFGGTKVLDFTVEEFEKKVLSETLFLTEENTHIFDEYEDGHDELRVQMIDGYAPFCKLVVIKNFTEAKVGSLPITLENHQYLRSGYSARRESELPVFSRWFELPLDVPKAEYLMLVLYSKEQIDEESNVEYEQELSEWTKNNPYETRQTGDTKPIKPKSFDADWGIVAILGQSHPGEEPMKPETMLRNALGKEEGGSGHKLNREDYQKSVDFWSVNATVK